jgi:large subunit ribosomal protein L19
MNVTSLIKVKTNPNIPEIAPGDTVRVSIKVVEGGKERLQPFQGVVIKVQRGGLGASFTVRRIAYGVGIERTFPLYSPRVEKVEVIRHGKVRRAKLYYLRGRSGKAARIKERRVDKEKKQAQVQPELEPVELEPVQTQEEPVEEETEAAQIQEETELEQNQDEQASEEPVQAQAELIPEEPIQEEPETVEAEEELENKPE